MYEVKNPFEYEQATKLSIDEIRRYYIDDFTYSRFVSSKRNIFLVGERGTGKTMAFLFFSLDSQVAKSKETQVPPDLSLISVYVPCNTPLFHRREFELLDPLNASLVSEHFIVVSMIKSLFDAISIVPDLMSSGEEKLLRTEIEYMFNFKI